MRRALITAMDQARRMRVRRMMRTTEEGALRSLLDTALTRVGRIVCGWRGHTSVLQFDQSRVFLQCMSCGHQSPGWQVDRVFPLVQVVPVRRASGTMSVARKVA